MAVLQRPMSQIAGLSAQFTAVEQLVTTEQTRATGVEGGLQQQTTQNLQTLTESIQSVSSATLQQVKNLQDLTDIPQARTNLDVFSKEEVTSAIQIAAAGLGGDFTAANVAARNALTGLSTNDDVFVQDNGNGQWAHYKVTAVDATGKGTAWALLMDQQTYTNINSAAALKQTYESNPNTNAFTDADKTLVALLTATKAVNLDSAILSSTPMTDPLMAAIKTYVDNAATQGGSAFATETPTVTNNRIVLGHAPKGGVILNFYTVRNIDATNIAYDIPVAADPTDATGKTFVLSPDTSGQFDTKTVTVQYPYTTNS